MYKKFTFIVVISIIIFGPIGQFILFKYTPIYNLNLLTKLYDDAEWVKGKPKVLIMGSSHARYHIIPSEIAKMNKEYEFRDIVNIGENAASPFEMYTAYNKQKEKFKDLEIVYYTLEPHMWSEKYYPYNTYEKIFLNYEQWNYLEKHHKKQNEYFFPFQAFISSLKFSIADRSKTNGYTAIKHKKFKTFSKGSVAKQIFTPLKLFPVSHFNMQYLGKLKKEVEANGAKFILLETPTYSWQKRYAAEAIEYDNTLIKELNKELGPTPVIGSFWAEDYDLRYKDYKDDTHLAHSGALKFTRAMFYDISEHKRLKNNKIHHTFTYRFKADKNKEVLLSILKPDTLTWHTKDRAKIENFDHSIKINASSIHKNIHFYTKIPLQKEINSVDINLTLPKEKLKMISISLKYGKEYGHFFIKPAEFKKIIKLYKFDIDKSSKHFDFKKINALSIRLYPYQTETITDFTLKSIKFYRRSSLK